MHGIWADRGQLGVVCWKGNTAETDARDSVFVELHRVVYAGHYRRWRVVAQNLVRGDCTEF